MDTVVVDVVVVVVVVVVVAIGDAFSFVLQELPPKLPQNANGGAQTCHHLLAESESNRGAWHSFVLCFVFM